jgi:SnoaL-like domain
VEDLSGRTARQVLDDHLGIANKWVGASFERILDEDLRRNVAEDIVILINRGVFRGHEGVRQLAWMLSDELPEHREFEYTHVVADERIAFLEWTYEDDQVRVRDGADSYLIEDGKIVAQTIHYTVETK